ncbi:MAG TPA: hypothetical protein VGU01_13695 [Sphingomicrobium sp.]|nr:hypothetical protein [Sphingomicrobium sp.]
MRLCPYATGANGGKLYRLFTLLDDDGPLAGQSFTGVRRNPMVGAIAIAMFIALVGWGSRYFGWEDPDGKVQLALITSFILGIIGGFKARS